MSVSRIDVNILIGIDVNPGDGIEFRPLRDLQIEPGYRASTTNAHEPLLNAPWQLSIDHRLPVFYLSSSAKLAK